MANYSKEHTRRYWWVYLQASQGAERAKKYQLLLSRLVPFTTRRSLKRKKGKVTEVNRLKSQFP